MGRVFQVVARRGKPSSIAPTEVFVEEDGSALAAYDGQPLLRFTNIAELTRRLCIDDYELRDGC